MAATIGLPSSRPGSEFPGVRIKACRDDLKPRAIQFLAQHSRIQEVHRLGERFRTHIFNNARGDIFDEAGPFNARRDSLLIDGNQRPEDRSIDSIIDEK